MTTQTTTCPRCNGSGSHSYNLTHGTVCFGCWGKGEVVKKESQIRRESAGKAQKEAARVERAEKMAKLIQALEGKYGNDPRMARCPSAEWRASHLFELAQFDLSRQGVKIRDLLELEAYL
jgi:hypothetical protein